MLGKNKRRKRLIPSESTNDNHKKLHLDTTEVLGCFLNRFSSKTPSKASVIQQVWSQIYTAACETHLPLFINTVNPDYTSDFL